MTQLVFDFENITRSEQLAKLRSILDFLSGLVLKSSSSRLSRQFIFERASVFFVSQEFTFEFVIQGIESYLPELADEIACEIEFPFICEQAA